MRIKNSTYLLECLGGLNELIIKNNQSTAGYPGNAAELLFLSLPVLFIKQFKSLGYYD